MSRKDKFLRKCISCNTFKSKSDLIKITKDFKTLELVVMPNSTIQGRSAYICKDKNCIELAFKKKRLDKNLSINVNEDLKDIITTVLEK